MTTHDTQAREAAITASIKALKDYKLLQGKFGDTAARVAIPAAIDAYLSHLPTDDRIAEISEALRLHAHDDCDGKDVPTHLCNIAADFITALEADRQRMREALEREREHMRGVLWEHWLCGMICDHADKTDRAVCGCGKWQGDIMPNVGSALNNWLDHVFDSAAAISNAILSPNPRSDDGGGK